MGISSLLYQVLMILVLHFLLALALLVCTIINFE